MKKNSKPYHEGRSALINAEWISFFDIFFGHIHITITKHFTNKLRVILCRKKTDGKENAKKQEQDEDNTMMLSNRYRKVVFPEFNQAVGFFFPVTIDAQIDLCCKTIDELGDLASRIKCFCITKIINQPGELLCGLICINREFCLHLLPARLVLLNKQCFSHIYV